MAHVLSCSLLTKTERLAETIPQVYDIIATVTSSERQPQNSSEDSCADSSENSAALRDLPYFYFLSEISNGDRSYEGFMNGVSEVQYSTPFLTLSESFLKWSVIH